MVQANGVTRRPSPSCITRRRKVTDGDAHRWGAREAYRVSRLGPASRGAEGELASFRWTHGRQEVSKFTLVRSPHVFAKSKENFFHLQQHRRREIRVPLRLREIHPLWKGRPVPRVAAWRASGLAHHFPGCRVQWQVA